jgi:death-on-curing protein
VGTIYFPLNRAIKEHDLIIKISGGSMGILNHSLLESSLTFIQQDEYYPRFEDKLTHLVYSISMNHCFVDGNKRSSIALGAYFLEVNGRGNLVPAFLVEMENIILWVAKKYLTKEMLHRYISELIKNGELNEEIKLEITEILIRADGRH